MPIKILTDLVWNETLSVKGPNSNSTPVHFAHQVDGHDSQSLVHFTTLDHFQVVAFCKIK